jgi:hypothetical protein
MANPSKPDWYWPLGALSYASEIHDFFPEEAELLGAITILWNREELALRHLFCQIIASQRPAYAEAIWDRQPTHQARRDLLALALQTVKLTKRQAAILKIVLEKTKVVADRRNELIHAEYVVHGRTDQLHAKVKPPRSNKPAKHQKVSPEDLRKIVVDLEHLIQMTEATWHEFCTRKTKKLTASIKRFAAEHLPSQENPQSDSPPPSDPRKPRAERQPPPQSFREKF